MPEDNKEKDQQKSVVNHHVAPLYRDIIADGFLYRVEGHMIGARHITFVILSSRMAPISEEVTFHLDEAGRAVIDSRIFNEQFVHIQECALRLTATTAENLISNLQDALAALKRAEGDAS